MGNVINSYIFPHPPIIMPGIGGSRQQQANATIEACKRAAKMVLNDNPTTIIISTPHAPCFRDYIYISDSERLSGDFAGFGHAEISMDFENNANFALSLIELCEKRNISAGFVSEKDKKRYGISDKIDHGAMVPLYFIGQEFENNHKSFKVVHVSTPFLSLKEMYSFGECIKDAVENFDEEFVYIASGDLSHRLSEDAPAGFSPKGKIYDDKLLTLIRNADIKGILGIGSQEMEDAGECGTRSFAIMYGANAGKDILTEIISYEAPFGVGYLVAKISNSITDESTNM